MPKLAPERETVTLEEAARILGVSVVSIKRYLQRGWLTGRKKGLGLTNAWLVYRDSIDEYLRKVQNPPR